MALQRLSILIIAMLFLANVKDSMSLTSEQKQKCVDEFLEWCDKNEYNSEEEEDSGYFSVYSTTIRGQQVRIYCTVDYEGTDCLKEKKPWYHCLPNHDLTYKGRPLNSNSSVDDEICITKHRAYMSGYNVKFNKTAFEIRMKKFNKRMQNFNKNLNERMKNMNRNLDQRMKNMNENLHNRMENLRSRLSRPVMYTGRYYNDSDEDYSEDYDSSDESDYDSSSGSDYDYSEYYDSY